MQDLILLIVGLSGLKENLDAGLALLEHLWGNAVADQETYNKYVDKIAKARDDNKTQKGSHFVEWFNELWYLWG